MFSSPLLHSTSICLPTLSWGFFFLHFFGVLITVSKLLIIFYSARSILSTVICVSPLCAIGLGHKAFWYMIHHTFHYQSTKCDSGFQPIHFQTNWSLCKTSCHLICAPACSFHTHHHKPIKKQKSDKNAGEIDTMFGVCSWREGHLRLSELYMREWLRPLMDHGHAALIGVITE